MHRYALIKLKMTDSTVIENKKTQVIVVGDATEFLPTVGSIKLEVLILSNTVLR